MENEELIKLLAEVRDILRSQSDKADSHFANLKRIQTKAALFPLVLAAAFFLACWLFFREPRQRFMEHQGLQIEIEKQTLKRLHDPLPQKQRPAT